MDTIEAVIEETESAFNAGGAAALAATFAPGAWSVGVTGHILHGQGEILEVGRQLFAGALQGQRARYVIDTGLVTNASASDSRRPHGS